MNKLRPEYRFLLAFMLWLLISAALIIPIVLLSPPSPPKRTEAPAERQVERESTIAEPDDGYKGIIFDDPVLDYYVIWKMILGH